MNAKMPKPMPASDDSVQLNRKVIATLKLQTVETFPLYESDHGASIGQMIDEIIEDSRHRNMIPNRMSLDLNPRTADPADVDSF